MGHGSAHLLAHCGCISGYQS